jgi:hypothetical protein
VPARTATPTPAKLHADKAYHGRVRRDALRGRHIAPRIAHPALDASTKPGRHRWIAERDFARLHRNRRLLVRYECRVDIHAAFLHLARALI